FYRVSVVRLILPPLRDRLEDIPLLVRHFLKTGSYNKLGDGGVRVKGMTREALDMLASYAWPGNIRELVNTIERAVSFADGDTIEVRDLPEHIRDTVPPARVAAASAAPPPAAPLTLPPESFESTFKEAKEKWVSSFERDYVVALLK